MKKRGQAALEFMMTYGWAILIVIVAISALSYFGVLKADKFLPDTCFLGPGLTCLSHKATATNLYIVVQNNLGQDIILTSIAVDSCSYTSSTTLNSGEKNQFTLSSCSFGEAGDKLKTDVAVTYRDEESLYHTKTGELIARVE